MRVAALLERGTGSAGGGYGAGGGGGGSGSTTCNGGTGEAGYCLVEWVG